jgi:hypothetical protein
MEMLKEAGGPKKGNLHLKNHSKYSPLQLRAAFSGHGPKKSNLYSEGINQLVDTLLVHNSQEH